MFDPSSSREARQFCWEAVCWVEVVVVVVEEEDEEEEEMERRCSAIRDSLRPFRDFFEEEGGQMVA